MKYLEIIEKLHPDIIHHFLSTGESKGIPVDVQQFLKQIQWAAEIYEYERNITRGARELRNRILAQQGIDLDVRTCKSRIYAAINYFSIDNNVAIKVWEADFADKYEDLALLAIDAGEYKTAKACKDAALECRRRACEAAEKDTDWAPIFIISPEITPEELGFAKKSLKEIARKSNDGYYISLIESLPIEQVEKKRLLADANIQDVEYSEIPNEDE